MEYEESEDNMPTVFIKLMSAYITLEMSVEEAIEVIEKSYGVETSHIKAGLQTLKTGCSKARGILEKKDLL